MKKILITGFAPFGKEAYNPSIEAVRLLPDTAGDVAILKAELPVLFSGAAEQLAALIREMKPDAVICTGLAGGRRAITPEVIAVNLKNARIPDNAGMQPSWEPIDEDGPDGLFAALPVRAMAEALQEAGLPAALSFSAGTFVCNEVMYELLRLQRGSFPEMKAGFVHVPYAEEFPHPEGSFAMPLSKITEGLLISINVVGGTLCTDS